MNLCSKPGCTRAGAALLGYDYGARRAILDDPPATGEISPHVYVLCSTCAGKLRPPQGWLLDDLRTEPPLFTPADVSGVAVTDRVIDDADEVVLRRQLFFGYSA